MGKKLAILVGVDKYVNENDLPPCGNDLELMSIFVKKSNHYDDCLTVELSPKASLVKSELSNFIRRYQEEDIEEVFFYYTGHGTTIADDFLYLFTDFDKSKAGQTSLKNSELDGMLKSLNPNLAIKVVDACHSGTEYIKSDIDLQRVFEKSLDQKFEKTYFLFSSAKHERSWALSDYSVFTKSFAQSLLDFENKEIRYRDIMDYISDDVAVKKHQTPLFIQQADNTELFGEISSELVKEITNKISEHSTPATGEEKNQLPESEEDVDSNSQLDGEFIKLVKDSSRKYCDEEDALKSIASIAKFVNGYKWSETLQKLYDIEVEEKQGQFQLKSLAKVAKWIHENGERYFVQIKYKDESYQAKEKVEYENGYGYSRGMLGLSNLFNQEVKYKTVTKSRKVICGFEHSVEVPYSSLLVVFTPKEKALLWFSIFITYAFSKSKVTMFSKFEFDEEVTWQDRSARDVNQWKIVHCELKDVEAIKANVEQSLLEIDEAVMVELKAMFQQV
ncbi:caspase family protein [Marinifilum sp. JC120]|nr:caspase family protein [Marinifilum sp. JC120]